MLNSIAFTVFITFFSAGSCMRTVVPCPSQSNSEFRDCYLCGVAEENQQVVCQCGKDMFNLFGRCIKPQGQCYQYRNYSTIINQDWDSIISQFWSQKFANSTNPQKFPKFTNLFKFDTMDQQTKLGWTQAYYLYRVLEPELQQLHPKRQKTILLESLPLAQTVLNMTFDQMRGQVLKFINNKLQKDWTLTYFLEQLIDKRIPSIVACRECIRSYGLVRQPNSSIATCTPCSADCVLCVNDNCLQCIEGFNPLQNVSTQLFFCVQCPQNCQLCQNGNCQNCSEGYGRVQYNDSVWCEACPENCEECENRICKRCKKMSQTVEITQQPGHYVNITCIKCPFGCQTCTLSQCINCTQNWGLIQQNGTILCEGCSENCVTCAYRNCEECQKGYQIVTDPQTQKKVCQKCSLKCTKCQNYSCKSCASFFGLISDKISKNKFCTRCPPNCQSCKKSASECTRCRPGFALINSTKQCVPCRVSNCLKCQQSGNCSMCKNKHSLVDKKCIPETIEQIYQCYFKNQTYNIYDANSTCYPCEDIFCFECSKDDYSICNKCIPHFQLSQVTGKCQQCPQNCFECKKDVCTRCYTGFGVFQGLCQPCRIHGCLYCEYNSLKCDICLLEGQFNKQKTACQLVQRNTSLCASGCSTCYENNTRQCFSCKKGYFLQNTNRICRRCSPNCQQCISFQFCKQCRSYFVAINGSCVRCLKRCYGCLPNDLSNCTYCRDLDYFSPDGCIIVEDNEECFWGSIFNYSQCILCKNGYTLTPDRKCTQCPLNCKHTCNPLNITQCRKSKFAVRNFYIIHHDKIAQGCRLMVNKTCYGAEKGYKIFEIDGVFVSRYSCLKPCQTCNDSDIKQCFSCQNGYVIENNTCVVDLSCNPNCTTCPHETYRDEETNMCILCKASYCKSCFKGECLDCHQGYYFESGSCWPCKPGCKTCVNSQRCLLCERGYVHRYEYFQNMSLTFMEQTLIDLNVINPICEPCNQNCLTCYFKFNACTSCHEGMKLINMRCMSDVVVGYGYRFKVDLTQFLLSISSDTFIQQLSQILNIRTYQITIHSVKQGPTIIRGQIFAYNESNARHIYNTLQQHHPQSFTIMGKSLNITIQDKTIQHISHNMEDPPSPPEDKNKLSVGAIVGITVGSLAFVAGVGILVFFIVRKYWKGNQKHQKVAPQNNFVQTKSTETQTNR